MTGSLELVEFTGPTVNVNGSPLAANWMNALVQLRVERALCSVARTTMRFADPGYVLAESALLAIGTAVTVTAGKGAQLFQGVVTGSGLEQSLRGGVHLVVTMDDPGYRLGLGNQVATYLQHSYRDVLTQVAARAGLTADISSSASLSSVNEYLMQAGSDLAFVDELTRRAGCVWWIEDKALTVRPVGTSQAEATLRLGDTLEEFSVRASALRPGDVRVRGWDATAQQDIQAENVAAQSTAESPFVTRYLGGAPAQALTTSTLDAGDGNPNNADEAAALASALYGDWHAGAVVARGSLALAPQLAPLTTVQIGGAGPASGSYLVSEVEHRYDYDGFTTRFVAGPQRPAGLVDTLGQLPPDPGFAINGLLTARVSNNRDPDKGGRVKVSYAGAGGTLESAWARVVALGAGAGRGAVFVPEVGDEVLVGFERGDTRHPVVIGGLYSAKVAIPADDGLIDAASKISYRRFTSRLGHVIELSDGEGPTTQHVLLKTADGSQSVRVGADAIAVAAAAGKPVSIKSGDAKFEIDASGAITISGTKIAIQADGELTLQGATVGIKGQAQASIEAAMLDLKGNASANVSGGAQLALKAAIVMIN